MVTDRNTSLIQLLWVATAMNQENAYVGKDGMEAYVINAYQQRTVVSVQYEICMAYCNSNW